MENDLTQQDVQNIIALINNADIKVEHAEMVVLLKQKLIKLHASLAVPLKEVNDETS